MLAAGLLSQKAWRFEMAQPSAKAASYNEQAGDQVRRSAVLDAAIHYFQAALEQSPALDRAASQASM